MYIQSKHDFLTLSSKLGFKTSSLGFRTFTVEGLALSLLLRIISVVKIGFNIRVVDGHLVQPLPPDLIGKLTTEISLTNQAAGSRRPSGRKPGYGLPPRRPNGDSAAGSPRPREDRKKRESQHNICRTVEPQVITSTLRALNFKVHAIPESTLGPSWSVSQLLFAKMVG